MTSKGVNDCVGMPAWLDRRCVKSGDVKFFFFGSSGISGMRRPSV